MSLFRSRTRREKHRYFPSLTQHQRESVLEDEGGGEGDEADDAGAAAEEDEEAMFDGDERTRPGAADAAQTPAPPLLLAEWTRGPGWAGAYLLVVSAVVVGVAAEPCTWGSAPATSLMSGRLMESHRREK